MEKKIKKVLVIYGKLTGFGIGFQINKHFLDINLGFWYLGLEY